MDCKKARDLILGDYFDGYLNDYDKYKLEGHIDFCPSCQKLADGVRENAVMPFEKIHDQPVPVELWESIKAAIEKKRCRHTFKDRLLGFLNSEKFCYGLNVFVDGLCVIILVLSLFGKVGSRSDNRQVYSQLDGVSYFARSANNSDRHRYGTDIEKYFL